jgi:uncharacterized protein (DUF1501 family)
MSVRQMVKQAQADMLKAAMLPEQQREWHSKLTALLGNVQAEIREADALYAAVLLDIMNTEQKANRARIVAETTPAFHRKREAHDTEKFLMEMLRTLRQNMRSLSDEMRMGAA